jgi:DNA-binding SARP family transcriptional activator
VYASGLRKALGDPGRLTAKSGSYSLRLQPGELDLERFRSLVTQAAKRLAAEPDEAAAGLQEALSLWRGRAVADLGAEPGIRDVGLDLEHERLQATELLLEAELAAGRQARVVPQVERLLVEHPAREQLYRLLMLALYRSGRQHDALEVYRRARARLARELGIAPSPGLRDLEAAILRQDASLLAEPSELRARRHLPAQPFVPAGRERELRELVELITSGGVRLVTLTSPAESGKTALAVAVAGRAAPSFRDGVWFVEFGRRDVAVAVAETVGVRRLELESHLRDRELLLLLDAFEPVRDAAVTVSLLLRHAPGLKLLVTSREPLDLYGEHRYEVRIEACSTT